MDRAPIQLEPTLTDIADGKRVFLEKPLGADLGKSSDRRAYALKLYRGPANMLLACVIQTDTLALGSERCRQISTQLDFLVSAVRRTRQKISLPRWVPRTIPA